jgi:hypothetical protein
MYFAAHEACFIQIVTPSLVGSTQFFRCNLCSLRAIYTEARRKCSIAPDKLLIKITPFIIAGTLIIHIFMKKLAVM